MKKITVQIEKKYQTKVEVKAENKTEALYFVERQMNDGNKKFRANSEDLAEQNIKVIKEEDI